MLGEMNVYTVEITQQFCPEYLSYYKLQAYNVYKYVWFLMSLL